MDGTACSRCWSGRGSATWRRTSCAPWIPSCAPSATSTPRTTTPAGSASAEPVELAAELGGICSRRLADEALAEIGGGTTFEAPPPFQERDGHALARGAPGQEAGGEKPGTDLGAQVWAGGARRG